MDLFAPNTPLDYTSVMRVLVFHIRNMYFFDGQTVEYNCIMPLFFSLYIFAL